MPALGHGDGALDGGRMGSRGPVPLSCGPCREEVEGWMGSPFSRGPKRTLWVCGVWGRGLQAPKLLRSLFASRSGLQAGAAPPACEALSCVCPPCEPQEVALLCPGLGASNGEQEQAQDSLHLHPLATGSSIGINAPSYLSSQTGGQGHGRLWFLCGLLWRIRFP